MLQLVGSRTSSVTSGMTSTGHNLLDTDTQRSDGCRWAQVELRVQFQPGQEHPAAASRLVGNPLAQRADRALNAAVDGRGSGAMPVGWSGDRGRDVDLKAEHEYVPTSVGHAPRLRGPELTRHCKTCALP
eukprot:1420700-Rhodomonas_salina.3